MPVYGVHPSIKVEAGSTEITDHVSTSVRRPENGVSIVKIAANDREGVNYIGNFDVWTVLKVSLRYGSDSWTKVFEGVVEDISPLLARQLQTVTATAYGYGRALRNTYCNVNYGSEISSSLDTPTEIWDDLVDNHINKDFDGAATGYAITKTKIKTVNTPTITFLPNPYRKCIDVVNEVANIHAAGQAGSASVHWFVDPSKNLWIDTIANHSVDTTNWPTYYGGSQALSTLVEGVDFKAYEFHKHIRDFANKVLLTAPFRRPGYDYLTEDSGGQALWGTSNVTLTDDAVTYLVGSHSLKAVFEAVAVGEFYYPSGAAAEWDISTWGSEQSIPHVSFYLYKDGITELTTSLRFCNNDTARNTDYYYCVFSTWTEPDDEWIHKSIPIGPYWKSAEESKQFRWATAGNPPADWSDIDEVLFLTLVGDDGIMYIDDFHFTGRLLREAYNSTSIAARNDHQFVLNFNVSLDDTMIASDDSGTAAQLAYAELLARQKTPRVGTVFIPLLVNALPGEIFHIHADEQSSGAFRIDGDFRAVYVQHNVNSEVGFGTELGLSDDLTNTMTFGPHKQLQQLAKVLYTDPEAKNLKGAGVDLLVSRMRKDYP